ncbi:hypothetical protein [Pontibacter pudoricolor]|uniref:hypothetical protein n=1 Tax=Pontibacter pudoricolor TaxID=2694930 RepID=UPI001391F6F5|nr:hypothetical protein [Pontibacter pudoricolor]
MYKVLLLLLLIVVLVVSPLLAQKPTQPNRLELELDIYKTDVQVLPTPDSSLLVLTKTVGNWTNPPTFGFTKYNHQLQPAWNKKITLNPISRYITHFSEEAYSYIAFTGENNDDFQFVKLNLADGNYTAKEYNIEAIDSIYVFKVLSGNYFIVARSRKTGTPTLLHLNETSGDIKPLPAVYGTESTFSDILVHPESQQVSVVMSESNGRISRLQTKIFNADGTLLSNYFIHPTQEKRPVTAEITPGDSTSRLLIGNYSTRNLRYASGIFTVPVTANSSDSRYYSFLQLKNFFRYMKPKQEKRMRQREEQKEQAGKDSGVQYRLLFHDIYPTLSGYIISAEVYTTDSRGGNFNRIYGPTGYLVSTPTIYKRTMALALGFDKDGILLWDNSFPLRNMETRTLQQSVEITASPTGTVVIAYPDEDDIFYKVMEQDNYVEEDTELELQPGDANSKIVSTSMAGLVKWYGLNFAAFGWHRIKPANAESRMVFYINKISF